MKRIIKISVLFVAMWGLSGCKTSKDDLKKMMAENPEILFEAIEKNPSKFLEVVNKAARVAQEDQAKREAEEADKARDEEFKNPKKPEIQKWRAIKGNKNAPITVVEYSDFQCPFCKRGAATVDQVLKEYGDQVRLVFKHLPLDFHPAALPASQIFEAIANQDVAKAYKFHDVIFQNQDKMRAPDNGVKWMLGEAKKLGGLNMAKVKKDMKSDEVQQRIDADIKEATKYGFRGTPGYLINGVSLKGAYPFPEFKKIIDKHLKK